MSFYFQPPIFAYKQPNQGQPLPQLDLQLQTPGHLHHQAPAPVLTVPIPIPACGQYLQTQPFIPGYNYTQHGTWVRQLPQLPRELDSSHNATLWREQSLLQPELGGDMATQPASQTVTVTSPSVTVTTTPADANKTPNPALTIQVLFHGTSPDLWVSAHQLTYASSTPPLSAILVDLRDWAIRQGLAAASVSVDKIKMYLTSGKGKGPPGLVVRAGVGPVVPENVVRVVDVAGQMAVEEVDEALGGVGRRGYGVFFTVDMDGDTGGDEAAGGSGE